MKILVISSAAIPSPVPSGNYGGLEQIAGWFTAEAVKRGHDVTLISAQGSEWGPGEHAITNEKGEQISTMRIVETVPPNWSGEAEQLHYLKYKDILEKEYSDGNSIVIDHTWAKFAYLSKMNKEFKDMNILGVHHGVVGFRTAPPVLFPRFLGLSTQHAQYMSSVLKIPVRHIHNGIPLPRFPEGYDPLKHKGEYLLSLNRISEEKGIHDSIDVAVATNTPIILAGDDTKVQSQDYVNMIIERCRNSNGLAQYMGLVDSRTKNQLIAGCKALIACPKPSWIEAFGLYVVEGMAWYKPFIGIVNGGLYDIVRQGVDGYLASSPEQLKEFVPKIDDIDVFKCRENVEQRFSKEVMATNYLNMFSGILNKEAAYNW